MPRRNDLTLADESDVQEYYGLESYRDILEARQTAPAPTPEIAEVELQAAISRGDDPSSVRTSAGAPSLNVPMVRDPERAGGA